MKEVKYYCDKCGRELLDVNLILSATFDIPSYHGGNKIVIKEEKRMDLCWRCYAEITGAKSVWEYERIEV